MISSIVILVMWLVYVFNSLPEFKHYRVVNDTSYNARLSTIEELDHFEKKGAFFIIHVFCLVFFILEFLAYLISYYLEIRRQKLPCTIKVVLKPIVIFDLLTTAAFALHIASIVFVPVLISLRVFRICWFMRHWSVGRALGHVFHTRRRSFMLLLMTVTVWVLFFSAWVYYGESGSEESYFKGLRHTLWYGFITVTTVGYGDMRPITMRGKIIGAPLALLGVVFYALCAAVVIPSYLHYFRFAQYMKPFGGKVKRRDGGKSDSTMEVQDVNVPLVTKAE